LALDEHRAAFTPTLFYVPTVTRFSPEEISKQQVLYEKISKVWIDLLKTPFPFLEDLQRVSKAKNEAARKLLEMEDSQKDPSKLFQVWFPGVHVNIGGGSTLTMANKGNMEEMSNIVFAWMLDQIKGFVSLNDEILRKDQLARRTRLDKINIALHRYNDRVKQQKTESWGAWLQRNSQWVASSLLHPLTSGDKPAYMEERIYTWGLGSLPDSFGIVYVANGSRPRTPGRYAFVNGVKLGETFEHIHPVVGYRVEKTKYFEKSRQYRPISLVGDSYVRHKKNNGYEYRLRYPGATEDQVLPEWEMSANIHSYERLAIEGDGAYDYVDALDAELGRDIKTPRSKLGWERAISI
jgi:hypothetical protein